MEIEIVASPFNEYLEISTKFHFSGNTIGVMWEDWTKLNSYWHIRGDAIRHDIPYGTISGGKTVPLYAVNWVSLRSDKHGMAILNTGTPKHYVKEGVLGCVLAWGGKAFTNRQDVAWYLEYNEEHKYKYDCTLYGEQTIRSGAMALTNDSSEADIARAAQRLNSPLLVFDTAGDHISNQQHNVLDLGSTDLVVTAVYLDGGALRYRFYEGVGKTHLIDDLSTAAGCKLHVADLTGNTLYQVSPYQIGCLYGD